jgi:hypothetical protein
VNTESPLRIAAASRIWAFVPVASAGTSSLEVSVRRPNGVVDVLLWIPEYRHDWPQAFVTEDPIAVEEGAIVRVATEPRGAIASVRLSLLRAEPQSAARSNGKSP